MTIVISGLIASVLAPSVPAPPLVPYEAFGNARDQAGAILPLGSPIRTFIDGVDYSNLTVTYRADGSYQTQIAGNWYIGPTSETPGIKEGGDPNDPIMFANGDFTTTGRAFREIASWVTAGFQNLNLQEAVPAKQPVLLKIQTVTTQPLDGLSQYSYICNPTGSTANLAEYYFEKDAIGMFGGPTVPLSGTVAAGDLIFGDFLSTTYLNPNGDALKLVWNNPGGVDSPFGGADVVVDRVEFNASSGGALTWEPGNTIMTNAPAPGGSQEIHRTVACADTNSGSDFVVGPETGRPTAPRVTVVTPAGGERWTAGSTHRVSWTVVDDQDPASSLSVNLSWTTDRIAYNAITTGIVGTTTFYDWVLPAVDSASAQVLICARDPTNLLGCSLSNEFTIDNTPPDVLSTIPSSGQTGVPPTQDLHIVFTESMNRASVEAPNVVTISPAVPMGPFAWSATTVADDTLDIPLNTLTIGQSYAVTIGTGARDSSDPGKNLIPAETWSFTVLTNTAPTVAITAPQGGCWCGGPSFTHTIVWTMSDPETIQGDLVVYVNYTSSAGSGQASPRLVGVTSYDWTPPAIDATDLRIEVKVIDALGASRADLSLVMEIDSSAPAVVTATPSQGATNVGPAQPIILDFGELVDQNSVRDGFSIVPAVAGLIFNWAGDTVTINHADFAPDTSYTATVSGVTDDCDPGNPMPTYTLQFQTQANTPPTATVTAPQAGASFQPGNSITITWTMDDTETAPANLVVYVNYTSSAQSGAVSQRLVGDTTVTWTAPDIDAGDVKVRVTVIDEAGASVTVDSGTFSIRRGGLDLAVVGGLGILIAVVVVAALLFLLMKRRKKEAPEQVSEEEAPPEPAPRRAPPAAPRAAAPRAPPPPPAPAAARPSAPGSGGTTECPSCGTIVDSKDTECFMCGHKF